MAPEILRCERYDAKVDLWSVGAAIYEAATGEPPFGALNQVELLKMIENTGGRVRFPDEVRLLSFVFLFWLLNAAIGFLECCRCC